MSTSWRIASALCAGVFALAVGGTARGDDAKCEDAVAKRSRNIGNQEQKKNRKCVKDGSGDISGCVNTESPKAVIQEGKLDELFLAGGKCDPPSAFVNTSSSDIADDTEAGARNILKGAFGDPVDGIEAGSKCHDKIAKRGGKKYDTELKAFRKCVKDNAPNDQTSIDNCVATGVNDAKAQSTVQPKLLADMEAQCTFASPPAGLEDGDCASCVAAADCAACIGDIVDCQACLAMNNSNNGTADCDILNDGVDDDDCGAPPTCPIAAGEYTITQVSGGSLKVYTFAAFPFPAGGQIVQDVAAASPPNCVHDTVVGFPGGFSAPNFCVPALGYTVNVNQTGCGIGQIDSNGGSDYRVIELYDTSDSSATCSLPDDALCTDGGDASVRADITVGDGFPDVCAGTGLANAIVTVPVHTTTWQDNSAGTFGACGGDGVFNAGDTIITEFDQVLDFTTDQASQSWSDIDGDGCDLAGGGPVGGVTMGPYIGECLDTSAMTVNTVAAGGFGSDALPYDGSFATVLPNTVAGPAALSGAVCGSPPAINFAGGTVTRCIP